MKRYNLYRGGMHDNPTGRWVEYADVVEQRFGIAPHTPNPQVAAVSEWKGPYRCEKCGLVYSSATSNLNKGKCQLYCGQTLVSWNRRAPDPQVAALVKAAKELRDAMAAAMRVLVHYEDGAWYLEQELAKAGIENGFGKRIDATLAAMEGEGR